MAAFPLASPTTKIDLLATDVFFLRDQASLIEQVKDLCRRPRSMPRILCRLLSSKVHSKKTFQGRLCASLCAKIEKAGSDVRLGVTDGADLYDCPDPRRLLCAYSASIPTSLLRAEHQTRQMEHPCLFPTRNQGSSEAHLLTPCVLVPAVSAFQRLLGRRYMSASEQVLHGAASCGV